MSWSESRKAKRWARRRKMLWYQRTRPLFEIPTRIYEGKPGEGKTLLLSRDCIKLMRRGVKVYANYMIRDPITGVMAEPLDSWDQMLELSMEAFSKREPIVFALDEVHNWADRLTFAKAPGWWRTHMSQHRKFQCGIMATCQDLANLDVYLRRLVDELVRVRDGQIPIPRSAWLTLKSGRRVPWMRLVWMPCFYLETVDPGSVESRQYVLSEPVRAFLPWWAFFGYSTDTLVPVREWRTDEEADAAAAALFERALELRGAPYLPSVVDEPAAR